MSWLWGGSKKKSKPEELYKDKLDQLEKLGYKDRKKNLTLLKLYNGDVNHVLKDYQIQQPSSQSISPKPKPKPAVAPKQQPAPSQPEPAPQSDPKPTPKPNPKPMAEQQDAPRHKVEPKAKEIKPVQMAKPILKTEQKEEIVTKPSVQLLNNLQSTPSSDLRQLLLNIGEPIIAEIIFSNAISGEEIYDYNLVNPLLKNFSLSPGDQAAYNSLIHQIELSFKKHGAIDTSKLPLKREEIKMDDIAEEKKQNDTDKRPKGDIKNLISSQVRELILPFNVELAERLYAFSLDGTDLCKFDYDAVVFATGMKTLSKDQWDKIVTEFKLPQTEPFDKAKWEQLQKRQQNVINQGKKIKTEMEQIKQQISNPPVSKPQQQQKKQQKQKQNKSDSRIKQLKKHQLKQLAKIAQLEKETDKFLPSTLQKLKQRQIETLTKLHDVAAAINLDPHIIENIHKAAREEAEKEMAGYNKAGNQVLSNQPKDDDLAKQLETRQFELLSNINKMRGNLEKLAMSKGVSLEALMSITNKDQTSDNITPEQFNALNKQFDTLFQSLAATKIKVQQTASQYGVKLNNESEVNSYLKPMFDDLESKQNDVIAQLSYLNDQARMINPKAVAINEKILHITKHAHRRTSSGPLLLAVPHSPVESPSPHDHFPDTLETKQEYELHSEHPVSLPHSRSPSISKGIIITTPDETQREANQVRQRRKSLQVNAKLLSFVLKQFDTNNTGYLTQQTFVSALMQMNIEIDLQEQDMKVILQDVMDKQKRIEIEKLVHFICEQNSTLKLDSRRQWNSFRMKLICVKRKENHLRVKYRFDGWPESVIIETNQIATRDNYVAIHDVIQLMQEKSQDKDMEYKEMKYALRNRQKEQWNTIGDQKQIPLYVAKDGWCEMNIWLRTESFITKKIGKPVPKQ